MASITQDDVSPNGWIAVPLDAGRLFNGQPYRFGPTPLSIQGIPFPSDDAVVERVRAYAKEQLPEKTLNHSMRVYYHGQPRRSSSFCRACLRALQHIMRHGRLTSCVRFSKRHSAAAISELARTLSPSTLAVTSLLHDLGTTDENMTATRMFFGFYGGLQALRVPKELGAGQDQADAACEAIIRH